VKLLRSPHFGRGLLVAAAIALVSGGIVAAVLRHGSTKSTVTAPTTTAAPPPATTAPPPATTAPATTQPPPQPPQVAMSWDHAGAIIWHVHDSDPTWLGRTMRAAGFGWAAVYLGAAGKVDPPDPGWIAQFRSVSGLPVGGWSVLGDDPAKDAADAARLVRDDGLSFYIADAEAPYNGHPERSQAFVSAFRSAQPALPAGLSSICDANGVGLSAWAGAGFVFLPQAYVNDFGQAVAPAACVRSALPFFARSSIHPMVACYQGTQGYVTPTQFARLLAQAGTTGFSIYPAETLVNAQDWQTYAQAIASTHIAAALP
jgi:hypothetical protein